MQNSGLGKTSEAAACVHSQASLGRPVSVQTRTYSMRVQTPFNNSQPGRKRSGPKYISPRVSELLQETTGDLGRPHT